MDSREIAALRKIRFETGRKINTLYAGEYVSAFRGYGLSFDSVREYVPGDDVRSMDWNVTARMNHLYVRKYIEERELSLVFMVDVSGSTDFGGARSKRDLVFEFLAVMLYLAQINGDRVSVLLFSDKVERFMRPGKGRRFVLRVIDEVAKFRPVSRKTDITGAVDFLQRVMKKRSVVFVISDFMDKKGDYLLRLKILARKHDVIPVQIYDPLETGLNIPGLAEYLDLETGETFLSDTFVAPSKLPETGEFDTIRLSTEEQIEYPLLRFFSKRKKSGSVR